MHDGRGGTRTRVLLLLGPAGPRAPELAGALADAGELVVVGAPPDAAAAIEAMPALAPDVVLVDRLVGLADGLAVARHLHRDHPRAGIVLRTPWPDADLHDARRAGAHATVDVAASLPVLAAAIAAAGPRRADAADPRPRNEEHA